jgi:predicted enzyme related to lactoylglutathione lyase
MTQHARRALSVVVYAKDSRSLARFYSSVLALKVHQRDERFTVLTSDDVELAIIQAPPDLANAICLETPPRPRVATPIKLSILVENIEAMRNPIVDAGGTLNPIDTMWSWNGAEHLDGCDSEGNIFQLRQKSA